jgi:hypothetical protein
VLDRVHPFAPRRCGRAGATALLLASVLVATPARAGGCPVYGRTKVAGVVRISGINEASGLVASRRRHSFWFLEDSGNPARVYQITPTGRTLSNVRVTNGVNRDWEDIAYANGTVWAGDIGGRRNDLQVYWFPEPGLGPRTVRAKVATLRYANGATHNAEAMFVDPSTMKLFVVTKERSRWEGLVYRVDVRGLRSGGTRTLRRVGRVPIGNVTAADAGARGFVVRTLSGRGLFYRWRSGRSVDAALRGRPCEITVARGESIAFSPWAPRRLTTVPEGTRPQVRFVVRRG